MTLPGQTITSNSRNLAPKGGPVEDHEKPSDEERAQMSSAEINNLPDSAFAYIEPGGEKDADGKTTPRSLRHYPVQDKAHAQNALSRAGAALKGDDEKAKGIAQKAMPKIKAAAEKFGIGTQQNAAEVEVEEREESPDVEYRRRKAESLRGTVERRQFSSSLECRTLDDGTIRMGGYASVTETPYQVGPFTETIKRGAFKRTLSEDPSVVFLANHEGLPMATTKSGTLVLHEDARGLRWDADLDPLDEDSATLARKVERGLVEDCSFAFLCTDDSWSEDRSRRDVRSLSLHKGDVSCVTYGASEATSVSLRELVCDLETRAGKVLSGANLAEIEAIHEASGRLIELSKAPEPESGVTPTEVALEAVAEQTEEIAREADEPPEKAVLVPDGKRERERLAALRRAA